MHDHVFYDGDDPHERVYCQIEGCWERNPKMDNSELPMFRIPWAFKEANKNGYTMWDFRREDYEGMKQREASGGYV